MRTRLSCMFLMSLSVACAAQEASRPPLPSDAMPNELLGKCTRAVPRFTDRVRAVFQRPSFTQATVVAQVEILPPGRIGAVSIRTSSGFPEFDEMALQAYTEVTCSFPEPLAKLITAIQSFTFSKTL